MHQQRKYKKSHVKRRQNKKPTYYMKPYSVAKPSCDPPDHYSSFDKHHGQERKQKKNTTFIKRGIYSKKHSFKSLKMKSKQSNYFRKSRKFGLTRRYL